MPYRLLDILMSLMGLIALLEKHHFLFASIASLCTIFYWFYRFVEWSVKKITSKSVDDFEKGANK
jgi:hypothetical protein